MKKRIQIFLVFIFISLFSCGQTINVTNVTPTDPYCAGNSITVDYTVGIFGGTSAFTIELGNFGTFPGTILATNTHGTGAQSFTVTLPPNTATGNYRIRVNRVSPIVNSNNYFIGTVKPPEISVSSVTTTWCAGSTQTVNFTVTCGKFNTTNDFTVQLSNA
ncbi:MAG TPA: hypothetical protein PK431_14985, partial [Chitinophagales bacterium]|nr:hypothetical protein [Chitinophagales bacterium]